MPDKSVVPQRMQRNHAENQQKCHFRPGRKYRAPYGFAWRMAGTHKDTLEREQASLQE